MTAAELKYMIAINQLYDGKAGINLTSIAAQMGVSKVSVYRAVERLEKDGYARRDEKNKVVITEHGYEQFAKYMQLIGWLADHFEKNCLVDDATAREDAIAAVCAISDSTRHGIFAQMSSEETKHDR